MAKVTNKVIRDKILSSAGLKANADFGQMTTQELASNFYAVYKRVISQKIDNQLREVPGLSVITKEQWRNGLKEYFNLGLGVVSDFDSAITLDTFNPSDFPVLSQLVSTQKKKVVNYKIYRNELIDFFTKPNLIVDFVNEIISRAKDTMKMFLFTQMNKILMKTSDAELAISFDKEIDVTGKTASQVLSKLRNYIASLATPSNTHLLKPADMSDTDYKKFVYSAMPENLIIVWNTPFFTGDIANLKSTLFNKEDVIPKCEMLHFDFSLIDGVSEVEAEKIKCFVIDKEALKIGLEIDVTDITKMPNLQVLYQDIMFYGWMRRPNFVIAKFYDSSPSARSAKKKIPGI